MHRAYARTHYLRVRARVRVGVHVRVRPCTRALVPCVCVCVHVRAHRCVCMRVPLTPPHIMPRRMVIFCKRVADLLLPAMVEQGAGVAVANLGTRKLSPPQVRDLYSLAFKACE